MRRLNEVLEREKKKAEALEKKKRKLKRSAMRKEVMKLEIEIQVCFRALFEIFFSTQPEHASCNQSVDILQQTNFQKKPKSECVRMACDSLLTTSLLQVVNSFVASLMSKLVVQACCKLFQQVVTSLQMTSCNEPDFNRLFVT